MVKKFNSLFERFLVFLTTSSFMLAVFATAAPVFNKIEQDKILINWISFVIIFISALIFILIDQIFAREKIKTYLHIVVIVFYEFAAVLLGGDGC